MTAPETSSVAWGGRELPYTIRRSARRKKTVAVTVDSAGSVLVVAPERFATTRLDVIVVRKAAWIAQRLRRLQAHGPAPRELSPGSGGTRPSGCPSGSMRGRPGPASRRPASSSPTSASAGEAATTSAPSG